MTPKEFADKYLYPYRIRGEEIIRKYCPFCHGGMNRDKDTFALNTEKKIFNCKRGSCAMQGTFNQLCKEFGERADIHNQYERKIPLKKNFKKPEIKSIPVSKKIEEYLIKRGISKITWENRKVAEHNGNIVFPYYENRELVLIKYKIAGKPQKGQPKSWREPGGKSILWGMDDCNPQKPLVITEGEMDALSLDECGIENVVSVPSGANDLTCIDNNWDWLQQFNKRQKKHPKIMEYW